MTIINDEHKIWDKVTINESNSEKRAQISGRSNYKVLKIVFNGQYRAFEQKEEKRMK